MTDVRVRPFHREYADHRTNGRPSVSKWMSNEAVRYHHGLTTTKESTATPTTTRARPVRIRTSAATHTRAIHSVATNATSCSQSSWTGWGQTRPIRASGHMASSKWLCQNGELGDWMVLTGSRWPCPISHHAWE